MATVITEGWDLLAVANQSLLNQALNTVYDDGVFPTHINNYTLFDVSFTGDIGVPTTDLNPASASGTNSIVSLSFPISGTLTYQGTDEQLPNDAVFTITSNLKYVSIEIQGTSAMQLYLDLSSNMAVYSATIGASNPPAWLTFLNAIIQSYFQDTYSGGTYYLGTVNMEGAPASVLPTGDVYFATQPNSSNPDANLLAMVANTSTGSVGTLDFPSSSPLLPSSEDAALYISNRCLLNNLVLPVLSGQLDTPSSSFTMSGNASTPYTMTLNTDVSISAEYDPVLTAMSVSVNNSGQIQSDYAVTGYPLSAFESIIWVDITGNFYLTPELVDQAISILADTPEASGSVELSAGGWVIVAALIIATFGALGAVAGAVVAVVIPVLITQLDFSISMDSIADSINDAGVSFDWPAQELAPITSVALPGDLVLYLDPKVS